MNDNNEVVTVTLSLTKHQWKDIIQHIMNDASMLEMGLCAQADRDADLVEENQRLKNQAERHMEIMTLKSMKLAQGGYQPVVSQTEVPKAPPKKR
jgi:hypothetical protein